MKKALRFALLTVALQALSGCGPAKPPQVGSATPSGPIQFAIAQIGSRGADTMTLKLSLQNTSDRELYVSFRPQFDWIALYIVTHTIRLGEGESTGVPVRPSLRSVNRPMCPEPESTFAIPKGETLFRVIKLEIPEGHRAVPKLDVLVNLEVPVFDATLSCREKPWVSGAAATVVE